jgi:hypothetical protein
MVDEYGAFVGIRIGRENRLYFEEKPAPLPLFLAKIPHD